MRFTETILKGAFVVEPEPFEDERGFFARIYCAREFAAHGLHSEFVQGSTSLSRAAGTIRGLHFQRPPGAEVKLVRCTAGAILDVIVDLRPESPTYLQHVSVELTALNRHSLYVPQLFAHGFQVLTDNTEVSYQISEYHAPDLSGGLRYDDPVLGISWPLPATLVSEKDRRWPLLDVKTVEPR